MNTNNLINLSADLQTAVERGIMSLADAEQVTIMNKKEKIKQLCGNTVQETMKKGVPYYTVSKSINGIRKQFSDKSLDGLYKKVAEFLQPNPTFEECFIKWQDYRRENVPIEVATIDRTDADFKRWFTNNTLGKVLMKKPITDITLDDYKEYFNKLFKNGIYEFQLKKVKGIFKNTIATAIEDGLTVKARIEDINFTNLKCKVKDNSLDVYSNEDAEKLFLHILELEHKDAYDYLILLDFCFTVRIAELKVLRYQDLMSNNTIHIWGQYLEDTQKISDYTKGSSASGYRYLKCNKMAIRLLEELKYLKYDEEYLLKYNGHFLYTDVANKRLKRYCRQIGITYHSSHKIRFYNACKLIEKGYSISDLQRDMGHRWISTTYGYASRCIQRNPNEEYADMLEMPINIAN